MPRKPKRPCSHPGCPRLTDGRFCEEHQRQENSRYEKYDRDPVVRRRYGRVWKRIRDSYLVNTPLVASTVVALTVVAFTVGILAVVASMVFIYAVSHGLFDVPKSIKTPSHGANRLAPVVEPPA